MDPTHALAASQAARRLGLSKTMVCLLCREGKLKAVRTALGWLIDPEDVERLKVERARSSSCHGRRVR